MWVGNLGIKPWYRPGSVRVWENLLLLPSSTPPSPFPHPCLILLLHPTHTPTPPHHPLLCFHHDMYLSSAVNHTCVTEEEFQELVESVVAASSLSMNPLADDPGDANIHWSIPNAIFFSCSVITTIGEPFLSSTRLDRHMAYNNFWAAVSPPPWVSHFYPRQDYRHMAITFQLQCHHRDRWAISILDKTRLMHDI